MQGLSYHRLCALSMLKMRLRALFYGAKGRPIDLPFALFPLHKLRIVQGAVKAAAGEELLVVALLGDAAVLQY